jgi:hypothetical protein
MATTSEPGDPLLELQLQVARRADVLVASSPEKTPLNFRCWFQAEEEVLGPLGIRSRLPASALPSFPETMTGRYGAEVRN